MNKPENESTLTEPKSHEAHTTEVSPALASDIDVKLPVPHPDLVAAVTEWLKYGQNDGVNH